MKEVTTKVAQPLALKITTQDTTLCHTTGLQYNARTMTCSPDVFTKYKFQIFGLVNRQKHQCTANNELKDVMYVFILWKTTFLTGRPGAIGPMTTLCQMEILNFLWFNWDQYLPLAPT